MRILDLYILRLLVAPFLFSLTALTALMLLDQVAKTFRLLVGKGLGWQIVLEVFVLTIPFLLAVIVPMAVLVTVLYTFTRLASDNEITAMKGSGISLFRIALPVVFAGVLVGLGLFWFNDNVLPDSNHRLQTLRQSIGRKSPTFALNARTVTELVDRQLFLEAQRVDPETSRLTDVTIWDASRPELVRTIIADSGTMALNPAQTDLYLTLHNGEMRESEAGAPGEFRRIWFETQLLRVPDVGNELDRSGTGRRGDRELPIDSMRVKAAENYRHAVEARRANSALALSYTDQLLGGLSDEVGPIGERGMPAGDSAAGDSAAGAEAAADTDTIAADTDTIADSDTVVDTAAAAETDTTDAAADADTTDAVAGFAAGWRTGQRLGTPLAARNAFRSHATRRDRYVRSALELEVEIWKKYSLPAACVIFALIGVPLAVRYHRGGISFVVGVSFLVFTAYYVALIGGESIADEELLSPFWAMWAPNVLFLLAAIGAFFHSRRAGG